MEYDEKLKEMGRVATTMCQLHLEDPKKFDHRTILDHLFNKFEELDLEEELESDG